MTHFSSDPIDRVVGRNLRRAREAAGISCETLALSVHASADDLTDIELDRSRPDADLLFNLARVLGVSLSSIFIPHLS